MPYEITQCYLPPGRDDFPAFTPEKLVLDLATPEGCKAELSTQLAFNECSMQWLGLSCTSNIVHLYCLQMNFLNNSIGSLSDGVYGLNLPRWPSKPCTLVVHHLSLTSCNIARSLSSSNSHQLSVPRHNLSFGSCAFRFSTSRVWNSLPVNIHESQSHPIFRCHLKTFYFQSAYPISAAHLA